MSPYNLFLILKEYFRIAVNREESLRTPHKRNGNGEPRRHCKKFEKILLFCDTPSDKISVTENFGVQNFQETKASLLKGWATHWKLFQVILSHLKFQSVSHVSD